MLSLFIFTVNKGLSRNKMHIMLKLVASNDPNYVYVNTDVYKLLNIHVLEYTNYVYVQSKSDIGKDVIKLTDWFWLNVLVCLLFHGSTCMFYCN